MKRTLTQMAMWRQRLRKSPPKWTKAGAPTSWRDRPDWKSWAAASSGWTQTSTNLAAKTNWETTKTKNAKDNRPLKWPTTASWATTGASPNPKTSSTRESTKPSPSPSKSFAEDSKTGWKKGTKSPFPSTPLSIEPNGLFIITICCIYCIFTRVGTQDMTSES